MQRIQLRRVPLGAALSLMLLGLLAFALVWSRGGQTTHVRLEVAGDTVSAFVEDRLVQQSIIPGYPGGGLLLVLPTHGRVPSLPEPRGIDSVRVLEAGTGQVLFEDDFSTPPAESGKWTAVAGDVVQQDGIVAAGRRGAQLIVLAPDWRDYTVELTAHNVSEIRVGVRATSRERAVLFTTTPFRHIDAFLGAMDGSKTSGASVTPVEFDRADTIRSITTMTLRPLPLLAGVLLSLSGAALLLGALRLPFAGLRLAIPGRLSIGLAAAVSLIAFATALVLSVDVAGAVPHVPDELSYLFQARLFASLDLAAAAPPEPSAFNWGEPSPLALHDGKWASIYPFGYPAVLALGLPAGAPWLVNPLLGGACCFLVFLIGSRVYRAETGLLASLLLAASPFFLMTASNFMAHTAAATYLLASLALLAYSDERRSWASFAAGIFLGLTLNTRPLTGAMVVPAVLLFLIIGLRDPEHRRERALKTLFFLVGLTLMVVLYFLYRYATTGDPFTTEPIQAGRDSLGFAGKHSLAAGLSHEQTQAAYLALVLHNWPLPLGVGLAILPFLLGGFQRWDCFLGLSALAIMGGYALYFENGLMHGPRFWFEAAPLLMLLSARGVELAVRRALEFVALLVREQPPPATRFLTYGLYPAVALLALLGSYVWLFGPEPSWSADFVPNQAEGLRRFNGIDDRMENAIARADIEPNSLVLVEDCPYWQCYGSVFWHNRPSLDGDVVYARLVPDPGQVTLLLRAFEDRYVYRANFQDAAITPLVLDGHPAGTPPRARDVRALDLLTQAE